MQWGFPGLVVGTGVQFLIWELRSYLKPLQRQSQKKKKKSSYVVSGFACLPDIKPFFFSENARNGVQS